MLAGIVKPIGGIVGLGEMNDTLRASARRCFEAGLLYGVNSNGDMIEFDPEIKAEILVKAEDMPPAAEPEQPAEQPEQPAEQPEQPAEQPEQTTEQPEQPADQPNADQTGSK